MERFDLVGIGSMVVDRLHRTPRLLGADAKLLLRDLAPGVAVEPRVGGVLLNQLGWAALLGLRCAVVGRQGDDANGRFLRAAMDRLGITRELVLGGAATSFAEIFVDDAGARAIYMAPGATAATDAEHVRRHHAETIRGAARFSTEISQLPLDAVCAALEIARAAGVETVLDFDLPPSDAVPALGSAAELERALGLVDLLKAAKAAARELAPRASDDALELARALRANRRVRAVVVTDGAAGCAIASADFEGRVAGASVETVDTTGAGDAFLGGLLAGLARGLGWEAAAKLGNACGGACAERLGAFPDEPEALRRRVLELHGGKLDLPALPPAREAGVEPTAAGTALASFDVALEELAALRARLDAQQFERALVLLRETRKAGQRVHVTGIGKPEHVAHYVASLFSSTGTPATFLHGTEAVHGSAGQIEAGDLVIAISNSGETAELRATVTALKELGAKIIGVTGKLGSWLARESHACLDAGVAREGGPLGLAPRASVAAEVLVLAALAAARQQEIGFSREEYARRHPAGKLGEAARR